MSDVTKHGVTTSLQYDEMTDAQRRAIVNDAVTVGSWSLDVRRNNEVGWWSLQAVQRPVAKRYVVEHRIPKNGERYLLHDGCVGTAHGAFHTTHAVIISEVSA